MKIKVSTGFSKERVENFYKFHMTRIDKMRYLFYFAVMGLFLITFISILLFNKSQNMITIIIVSLVANVILILTRPYRLSRGFKKAIERSPFSNETYHVMINNDGVEYLMYTTPEFYKWEQIVRLIEIDDAYYIYIADNKAIILPKYPVETEERNKLIQKGTELGIYKKYKY